MVLLAAWPKSTTQRKATHTQFPNGGDAVCWEEEELCGLGREGEHHR